MVTRMLPSDYLTTVQAASSARWWRGCGGCAMLDARTRTLGPDHPTTLTSRSNLAAVLSHLHRLAAAEGEYRALAEARTHVLGADHPDTLSVRSNLAAVLSELGQLDEAEAEYRAVLDVRIRVLGADHPSTTASRANLAEVMRERGQHAGG
jgi:hypothetical protein